MKLYTLLTHRKKAYRHESGEHRDLKVGSIDLKVGSIDLKVGSIETLKGELRDLKMGSIETNNWGE